MEGQPGTAPVVWADNALERPQPPPAPSLQLECQICFGAGASCLSCQHPLCDGCIRTIVAAATPTKPRIHCPTCSTIFRSDVLRQHLEEETVEALIALDLANPAPQPSGEEIVASTPSQPSLMAIKLAEKQYLKLAAALHLKKCPNCDVVIEKNGGCDNMMCSSCKRPFRWSAAIPLCKCNKLKFDWPHCKHCCGAKSATNSARIRRRVYAALMGVGHGTGIVLASPVLLPLLLHSKIREWRRNTRRRGGNLGPNIKMVIVGNGTVGKTSFLMTLTTDTFPHDYTPGYIDPPSINVMHQGRPYYISLWDTAGQEDYARLRPLCYPTTDVFLLCYDISARYSFENIEASWVPELRHHMPDTPIILCGMKVDLRGAETDAACDHDDRHRMVTTEEGMELARVIGAVAFREMSSLQGQGLDDFLPFLLDEHIRNVTPVRKGFARRLLGCCRGVSC